MLSYFSRMATTKRSVTLDEALVDEALEFVGERGLSRLLNEGLRLQVLIERGRKAVEEYEAEHGPISAQALADVDAQWPA
jgi:hypothetical protein